MIKPHFADQEKDSRMADSERRARGLEMIKKVYAGDVVTPPEGNAFTDVMLEQLFAEVWSRDVLSIRDRRILLMGIIAEKGEAMTFGPGSSALASRLFGIQARPLPLEPPRGISTLPDRAAGRGLGDPLPEKCAGGGPAFPHTRSCSLA